MVLCGLMWSNVPCCDTSRRCTALHTSGTNGRTSYFRWENFFDEQLGGESRLAGSLSSFLDIEMFVPIVLRKQNKTKGKRWNTDHVQVYDADVY